MTNTNDTKRPARRRTPAKSTPPASKPADKTKPDTEPTVGPGEINSILLATDEPIIAMRDAYTKDGVRDIELIDINNVIEARKPLKDAVKNKLDLPESTVLEFKHFTDIVQIFDDGLDAVEKRANIYTNQKVDGLREETVEALHDERKLTAQALQKLERNITKIPKWAWIASIIAGLCAAVIVLILQFTAQPTWGAVLIGLIVAGLVFIISILTISAQQRLESGYYSDLQDEPNTPTGTPSLAAGSTDSRK